MSTQERTSTVTLVSYTLILAFFIFRITQLVLNDGFTESNVIRLWVLVIVLAIVVTIVGMIFSYIASSVVHVVTTQTEPEFDDIQDERDKLINLKGTQVSYIVSSFGVLIAMLTFAFGQPPLVMFSLLICIGLVAQIAGDISRLVLYRRGV